MAENLQNNWLSHVMQKWGDDNIAKAVSILNQSKKSASGTLAKSLRFDVKEDAEKVVATISEAEYGKFVREGVRGSKSSALAPNSPFKYTNKMPPSAPIDRWVIKKGIGGTRDSKGRFIKRKSLVYLIRRKIFRFGIAPTNYLSPFQKNISELTDLMIDNQKNEILLLIESSFNDRTK